MDGTRDVVRTLTNTAPLTDLVKIIKHALEDMVEADIRKPYPYILGAIDFLAKALYHPAQGNLSGKQVPYMFAS